MKTQIRPRRLFVSGASRLSPNAALLRRELGRQLASDDGLVVITGGLQQRLDDPTALTADHMVVQGMLPALRARGLPIEEHLETVLPDVQQDRSKLIRFKEGRVRVLEKRNAQSRRFSIPLVDDFLQKHTLSNEAPLDQSPMRTSRTEIARCQSVTARSTFVVLSGDPHGWRSLSEGFVRRRFGRIFWLPQRSLRP